MRIATLVGTFILLLLAVTFSAGANPVCGDAVVEDSWVTVAPLPEPYYYNIWGAVAVNGKIYSVGDGVCECYDPDANNWTAVTPPPIYSSRSLGFVAVAACQNKIYVIGGMEESPTLVYDPSTDTWDNRTAMPSTISSYKANVVDDKIYVISGRIPSYFTFTLTSEANYVYDPATDSWSEMASIPIPVAGYASAVLDNKIYIIGGGTAVEYVENATNLVQIFNPKTNQWTNGTSMPTGVYLAGACSTSGLFAPKRIYVVGGDFRYNTGGTLGALWAGSNLNQVYDVETGNWSLAASLPETRWDVSLVNVNDTLYAVGGRNASFTATPMNIQATEKYTPTEYTLSPSPTPTALDGYTANLPIMLSVIIVIVIAAIAGLAIYHKNPRNTNARLLCLKGLFVKVS